MAEQTIMVPAGSPASVFRQVGMMLGIAAAVACVKDGGREACGLRLDIVELAGGMTS